MEVSGFFLSLVLILLSARILGEAAAWLSIPPVMGELLAGILLGPSILGWVEPADIIQTLAEIGLILLLFEVGLDTDIATLVNRGKSAAIVALGGFVTPFIGGALTATSIGVTVRVLRDLGRHQSHEAQVVLGAAVLDDILGVVLLALLFEFSTGGGVSIANTSKVFIFVVIFMLLAPIFLPFATSWQRPDSHFVQRIERHMKPIIHLFTPIFFVMVGLSLDLRKVDWASFAVWQMSLAFIVLAILSKLLGAFLIKESTHFRWAVGISMIPRAEVGLIFAELGRISGVFDADLYAVMILTIAATTVLPPFMLKWFYGRYGHHLE